MIVSTCTSRGSYMGYRPLLEAVDPVTMQPDKTQAEELPDGAVIHLGTLYMNGIPLTIPSSPTDLGDIPDYIPGATLRIRKMDPDQAKQIRVIKCGHLFIADRNLLKKVSWDDLNRCGLIFGEKTSISAAKNSPGTSSRGTVKSYAQNSLQTPAK